jgi:hypothetical protein
MLEFFPQVWNGTLREHYLLLFTVAGAVALMAGFVGAWIGARFATKRMVLELREALPTADQQRVAAEQLAQLGQALDVVALEVERLSEGQRFTAKMLADNAARVRNVSESARQPGVITPH